ncbi:hypothetical protein AS188_10135 [Kocuria flava]|uniref:Uncharacterized protein n=1 Tax=Kocuria flava TaxID=446860 RepID=A0A0U3G5A4_9MICC|nr:hypothetical protein AS188_10135 [Kocuria flava]GEO91537.1 hypothetical protein KFL01_08430 [Kocuria flava]
MVVPGVPAGRLIVRGAVLGACAGAVLMVFTHRASSLELGLLVGVVLEVLRAWVRGDLLEERPPGGTVAGRLQTPARDGRGRAVRGTHRRLRRAERPTTEAGGVRVGAMGDVPYELMTAAQAADALDAFLRERATALGALRATVSAAAGDVVVLDGTLDSVRPLWAWITDRVAELGVTAAALEEDPTRPSWPSWARQGRLVDPHPPAESLALVDGFVSYLAEVITDLVPQSRWWVGEHQIADHPLLNYPVLASDHHQLFLPGIPLFSAYQSAHGRTPMTGDEMRVHVARTVEALHGRGPEAAAIEEPLVTVVAEVDCFDVGLREDIPAVHPQVVEELIAELADRDGVASVHRYGPAALVVDVPDWDEMRLKLWLTLWLQRHLPR